MSQVIFLLPIALGLGLVGLVAFVWSLHNGQYEDIEGASMRILDEEDKPLPDVKQPDVKQPNVKQ